MHAHAGANAARMGGRMSVSALEGGGTSLLSVLWQPSPSATTYNIYVNGVVVFNGPGTGVGANLATTIDLGVVPETDQQVGVSGISNTGVEGSLSNTITVPASQFHGPTAPNLVSADAVSG